MIKAVRCDKSSFKQVTFKEGFNVILAERVSGSTDRDSRNGLGKSTLIDIIHFCLGSSTTPNEGLRVPQLDDWTFILDIELRGKDFSILRNTKTNGKVQIVGDFSDWPIEPEFDSEKDGYFMAIKDWTTVLCFLMFDLPISSLDEYKYHPSFRSLISYFIRRGTKAFNDPFSHFPKQTEWDCQINNAFLLGLNWEYAAQFQVLKDKEKLLENLKKASNEGVLQEFTGSVGELEAERVRLVSAQRHLAEELSSFQVHPQYYQIQEEANDITEEIHRITNNYTLNEQILNKYIKNIEDENDVSISKVKDIYEKAGLVFSTQLVKNLDDVSEFHKKIIENRKDYLRSEIDKLTREITDEKAKIRELSEKRASLLQVLESHGALSEHSLLQQRKISIDHQLEATIKKIQDLRKIEEFKSEINIEREELLKKTRRDFVERTALIEPAIIQFNKNSEALYAEPGILSIDISDTGYKYKVEIQRARSQGVNYMKIFCYDITLAQLHPDYPGILIHDSTIFDGVDERQIAKALQLATAESEAKGFQYICTLNSDIVPYGEFTPEYKEKFNEAIRLKLTDDSEEGSLLGIRY